MMRNLLFFILIIIFLSDIVSSSTIDIKLSLDGQEDNLIGKRILLVNKDLGINTYEKIDSNSMFSFESNLNENFKGVTHLYLLLCIQDSTECSGYPFFIPLYYGIGQEIRVSLFSQASTYFPTNDTDNPSITCSDTDLSFCEEYIFVGYTMIDLSVQVGGFLSNESGIKNSRLPSLETPEGGYFFGGFASDGLHSSVVIQPYIKKTIYIENPYNSPAKVIINLTNTSCFFEDNSQRKEILLNASESIINIAYCKNSEDANKITEINYLKIDISPSIISFSIIDISIFIIILIIGGKIVHKLKKSKSKT